MSRRMLFYGVLFLVFCGVVLAASGVPVREAAAHEGVQVVSAFERKNGEMPEGVAVDKQGNIYVGLGNPFWLPQFEPAYGAIWKLTPGGERMSTLIEFPGGPGPAGLAVSPSGILYFAYPNPPHADNGVYRLTGAGVAEQLPGSQAVGLANGLALSKQGDLYVSDSALGAIWRFPGGVGGAQMWLQHELLAGCLGIPGANGIAFWHGSLYVANTGLGLLARVPVHSDGTAGAPEIVAGDSACATGPLFGLDGIAFDVHGNVFAPLVLQHKLVRINIHDGSHTDLLDGSDGLFNPASIAFGTGKGNRQHVFLSNFALLEPGPPGSHGPAVLKYNVGVPGLPLP